VLEGDIHDVTSEEILKTAGLRVGEADVLIGGPPCQPFSKAAYWHPRGARRLGDPRASTLCAFLRVLRDTLPRTYLLENVPGIAYRGKQEGLRLIEHGINEINRERGTHYTLAYAVLNAAHYGVPQTRRRAFIIGARDGTLHTFPTPTHGKPPLAPYVTAGEALAGLDEEDNLELEPRGKWARLLPSIPEGENYRYHTKRGGGLPLFVWRKPYWHFLLKLSRNRPAWTIPAHPGPGIGPFHWHNRRLSARELCRLQTIPNEYEISGSLHAVQRQLGNAVPARLAEILARQMRRRLFSDEVALTPTLGTVRR